MLGRRGRRREAASAAPASVPVTRARILDGSHLWVTMAPALAGELVTRDPSGRVTSLDAVPQGPQTACLPLRALPGSEPGDFPLFLETGATELPLSMSAQPEVPTMAPTPAGSRWRHEVVPGGPVLTVRRERSRRTVPVSGVGVSEQGLLVTWTGSDAADQLVLVDDAGRQVFAASPTWDEGVAAAVLPADLRVAPAGSPVQVAVRGADGTVPLARRLSVLRQPNKATAMPSVPGPDGGRLSLRWSGAPALLQVVVREDRP